MLRRPVLLVCALLVFSCGRATVRERHRAAVVVDGISFDSTSVTALAHYASCPSQSVRIIVTGDEAVRTCLRGLAEGSTVELVERELKFKPMTCGAKPAVMQSFGPCSIPRDLMRTERSGQACPG